MNYMTLLLVDDDVDLLRLLQRRLERDGYDVIAAEGSRAALHALQRSLPDLAIVDILMPEMDGFEFLEALGARAEAPDIPVVVLTAMDLTDEDRSRLKGGVERVISKTGANSEELLAELTRLVDRSRREAGHP